MSCVQQDPVENYLLLGTFTLYTDERPRLLQFMVQSGKIFRPALHKVPKV